VLPKNNGVAEHRFARTRAYDLMPKILITALIGFFPIAAYTVNDPDRA
jgi:hypothetical protein